MVLPGVLTKRFDKRMNVLVTNDGSERSLEVLPHAGAFARAIGADLLLLRVLDPRSDCADELSTTLDEAVERTSAAWTADLAEALARHGVAGQPLVVIRERAEDTWDTIGRAAAAHDAFLIAMATRGAGRLHHLLAGSVAMGLVGSTDLPVMVTGPKVEPPITSRRYHLLATTDGSPASMAVVRAVRPAVTAGLDVTLLRLCWPGAADEARAECDENLARLRAELPESDRIAELVREVPLVDGVVDAIVAASTELGASAIAMATHGHGAAYHLFAGSVALSVVGKSPLPVILARSRPS